MKIGDKVRIIAEEGEGPNDLTSHDVQGGFSSGCESVVTGGMGPFIFVSRGEDRSEWAFYAAQLELINE